jgi:hypothetical protein
MWSYANPGLYQPSNEELEEAESDEDSGEEEDDWECNEESDEEDGDLENNDNESDQEEDGLERMKNQTKTTLKAMSDTRRSKYGARTVTKKTSKILRFVEADNAIISYLSHVLLWGNLATSS